MNIIRFEMNVPKQVALGTSQGTLVEGRYGDRVMYRLFDGRVMYVPPVIAAKIEAQGIIPGELFELCKTQIPNGSRRTIEWRLRRVESEHAPESTFFGPGGDPSLPETQLEADLRASLQLVHKRQENRPEPIATCDPGTRLETHTAHPENANGAVAPELNGHRVPAETYLNGNGSGRVYESLDSQPTDAGPTTKLEHALKTAISAAYNAEKFGTELGYVVRFDADAIKSMAITVLINMTQGARR